ATIGIPFSQEKPEYFMMSVKSVFAQSCEDWELLLVADNASRELRELAKRINDPRVTVIDDGRAIGLAARLNQIAMKASGDFLVRMDADDIMHPRRLEESLRVIASSESAAILSSGAYQIDEDTSVLGRFAVNPLTRRRLDLFFSSPIIHPTVV